MPPFTFERLPNEILGNIVCNLDCTELLPVALTSHRLYSVAKDNQLWATYCKKILNELHFPDDLILVPSDGYVKEYIYQKRLDKYVEFLIQSLSNHHVSKVVVLQQISRLGLRAKRTLDRIIKNSDYSQFNIQQRYFASNIGKSLLYSQTVMRLYNMFYKSENLDFFSVYLMLDAFSDDPDAAAHKEKFYATEINVIKAALADVKLDFKKRGGNNDEEAVNSTVQRLTDIIEFLNLSYDFSKIGRYISETRSFENLIPQPLLSGVFGSYEKTRKFSSPLYMVLGAAIYKYFAEWIGLQVTLIPLKFNLYLRVENPNYNSWTLDDEEYYKGRELPKCIYVDATRGNKVRSHRELEEISRIFETSMFSHKEIPSPHLSMQVFLNDVSTFMNEIHRFELPKLQLEKNYLGVMLCAYAFGAANRAKKQKVNVQYNNIKSTFRVEIDMANLNKIRDTEDFFQILENGNKISRLWLSKHEETEPLLQTYIGSPITYTHLYNMIKPAILAKPFLLFSVFTEVIMPFAPESVDSQSKYEMLLSIEKIISNKQPKAEPKHTVNVFDSTNHVMTYRNHGSSGVFQEDGSEIFDPSQIDIGSAVRYSGVSHGVGIIMKVTRQAIFHNAKKCVFYEVFVEDSSVLVLREKNVRSLCTRNSTFQHLLKINSQFFGIDAGRHFKKFDENLKRYILA